MNFFNKKLVAMMPHSFPKAHLSDSKVMLRYMSLVSLNITLKPYLYFKNHIDTCPKNFNLILQFLYYYIPNTFKTINTSSFYFIEKYVLLISTKWNVICTKFNQTLIALLYFKCYTEHYIQNQRIKSHHRSQTLKTLNLLLSNEQKKK